MQTAFQSDDEVTHIAHGLVNATLPKSAWTHAAHFAASLWLLRRDGLTAVSAAMPEIIRRYNEACGLANTDTTGYHETITLASLQAAEAHLRSHAADQPLHDVVNRLMATDLGRPDWLMTYWTRELLFSPAARRVWLAPDLKALPFASPEETTPEIKP